MNLKLKDIGNNPFRDLTANPLIEEKIQELMASIKLTGYWQNVVVTEYNGKYVLAYGHHRLEAAKRCGITEADFIVMDLDDTKLIQVMDNENRETYGSSPASLIESVKAVVSALAEGTIEPFPIDWQNTNLRYIRYAPSYAPAKETLTACGQRAYTVVALARFLGRTSARANGQERVSETLEAALNFLHLKELGAVNNSVLVKDGKPVSASKLYEITSDLKQRTEKIQERRGKTQAELAELREKQLAAQIKAKDDEQKAEAERKALVKKLADAQRAENERKADALKAELKAKDERAKEKEALNKLRMAELDAQLEAKKQWEKEQRVQDDYAPVRRDVETMMTKLETIVSEKNPFREQVKALAYNKKLLATDRLRLRKAVMAVSNWYADWVVPQFSPELKAMQKQAVVKLKEKQLRTERSGA